MKRTLLDPIDRKILRVLQRDGRISNAGLAAEVGLSPTVCWNRMRALEAAKIISGYVALIDQSALGMPDTVIIEITLNHHDEDSLERFAASLSEMPEVIEAFLVSGEYDYIIKVAVAGTEGYERFLRQRLYRIPGIRYSRSSFALRCLKQTYSVQP